MAPLRHAKKIEMYSCGFCSQQHQPHSSMATSTTAINIIAEVRSLSYLDARKVYDETASDNPTEDTTQENGSIEALLAQIRQQPPRIRKLIHGVASEHLTEGLNELFQEIMKARPSGARVPLVVDYSRTKGLNDLLREIMKA